MEFGNAFQPRFSFVCGQQNNNACETLVAIHKLENGLVTKANEK